MTRPTQDQIFAEASANLRDLCDDIIAGKCKHMSAEDVQLLYGTMAAIVNIVAYQNGQKENSNV